MAEGGTKWVLYGCLGCVGLVVLFLIFAGIVAGTAWLQVDREQVEARSLDRELPPAPAAIASAPEGAAASPPGPGAGPGTVVLDLWSAEFHVEPGEPLRVQATYDTRSYELNERFDPAGAEGWRYEVRFRRTGSSLITGLKELFGGTRPQVDVYLPVGVPYRLELNLNEGGAGVELGGLWLTSAELRLNKGGAEVDFHEPLARPIETLVIHGSMGGMSVGPLGNASPRRLDLDFSMGGVDLDLRGTWTRDAEISIRTSMGGGAVRLPRDVVIRGIDPGVFRVESATEVGRPVLTFSASSRMGDLDIRQ